MPSSATAAVYKNLPIRFIFLLNAPNEYGRTLLPKRFSPVALFLPSRRRVTAVTATSPALRMQQAHRVERHGARTRGRQES